MARVMLYCIEIYEYQISNICLNRHAKYAFFSNQTSDFNWGISAYNCFSIDVLLFFFHYTLQNNNKPEQNILYYNVK